MKLTITSKKLREIGVKNLIGEVRAGLIGVSFEWHLAGNEEARKIVIEYADKLKELTDEYERKIREATNR
jgi:hypothetical protein